MHIPRSDLPREVWVLAAVAFAVAVGFGIVAPVIPVFAREFGVGSTAAGAVVSAFAFMRLVFSPAAGSLVNRLGERLVLATGIGIVAVSSLLTGLAQSFVQMLALRAAGGVGSAMFTIGATSLLLRVAAAHQRGRANGMFYGGFLVGGVAGPFVGGVLGSISLRLPFFVYAGTLAVAGAIAMARLAVTALDEVDEDAGRAPPAQTTLRQALGNRAYRAALTVNAGTGWALFGIRSSLIPLFVVDVLLRGPLWTGIGLFVGAVTQVGLLVPAGRVSDRLGRRPAMIAAGTLGVSAAGLLALAQSLPGFLVAMALFGAAGSLLSVAPAAVVGDVIAGRGGTVVAAYGMSSDVGAVSGPLVAGALAEQSYPAAFAATAAVLAVGLVMSLRMPETLRRSPEASADVPR